MKWLLIYRLSPDGLPTWVEFRVSCPCWLLVKSPPRPNIYYLSTFLTVHKFLSTYQRENGLLVVISVYCIVIFVQY